MIVRVGEEWLGGWVAGTLLGSNARCVAMLQAFKEVIADYRTPDKAVVSPHNATEVECVYVRK